MLIKSTFIILSLNLFITFSLLSQHATEIIRGMTVDSHLGVRIANVKIYPSDQNDTIYSDSYGRFKIRISSQFRDNLYFDHSDYYPYLQRIKDRSKRYFQRIELINKSLELDTIFYPSFEGNRIIYGRVVDKQTMLPLNNAVINLGDNKRVGYTDSKGFYKLCLPKTTKTLIVSHPYYYSSNVNVPEIIHRGLKDVFIEPMRQSAGLDFWKEEKNSVRLIVNELLNGFIGIDYEKFLKIKHSVGLKSSVHLFKGINYLEPLVLYTPEYKGIELSAYYRYYDSRTMNKGFFYEGQISWGYFDFEDIYYNADVHHEYGKGFPEISNSLGFGGSIGWMIRFTPSHVLLNISAGAQYFSLNVPKTEYGYLYNDYLKFVLNDDFWHYFGPGSVVEVKFMIGGIF